MRSNTNNKSNLFSPIITVLLITARCCICWDCCCCCYCFNGNFHFFHIVFHRIVRLLHTFSSEMWACYTLVKNCYRTLNQFASSAFTRAFLVFGVNGRKFSITCRWILNVYNCIPHRVHLWSWFLLSGIFKACAANCMVTIKHSLDRKLATG